MAALDKTRVRRYSGLTFLLGFLVICGAVVPAQSTMAKPRLSLTPLATEYILGEPVFLKATLKNISNEPEQTAALLNPQFGNLILYISNDGKTFRKYLGPGWGTIDVFAKPKHLKPREHKDFLLSVLWNKKIAGVQDHVATELAFPEAGRYWLRARLLNGERVIDSNTIEIFINNPVGDDAVIWEVLRDAPQLALFIQYPKVDILPEHLAQLEALLQEYPNSSYAPYIREAFRKKDKSRQVEPLASAKEGEPIEGEVRNNILAVLNRYFDFYEQGNLRGVLNLITGSFLYNEALDKHTFTVELKEDFEKLKKLTGTFGITMEVKKLELVEGKPTAEVELSFFLDGNILSPPRRVRIELVQRGGNWLIESWKEM